MAVRSALQVDSSGNSGLVFHLGFPHCSEPTGRIDEGWITPGLYENRLCPMLHVSLNLHQISV